MKKILLLVLATIITHMAYAQTSTMTCPTCMGKGVFVCPFCAGRGLIYDFYFGYSACYNCGGAGSFKCGVCQGKGSVVLMDYNPNINYNNNLYNNSSSSSSSSNSSSRNSSSDRYGYKDCHSCKGTGICSTCDGDGYYDYMFGSGQLKCPNCHSSKVGRCGICGGTGKVYGVK